MKQKTTRTRFADKLKAGAIIFAMALPLYGGCVKKDATAQRDAAQATAKASAAVVEYSAGKRKLSQAAVKEIQILAGRIDDAEQTTVFKAVGPRTIKNAAEQRDLPKQKKDAGEPGGAKRE